MKQALLIAGVHTSHVYTNSSMYEPRHALQQCARHLP